MKQHTYVLVAVVLSLGSVCAPRPAFAAAEATKSSETKAPRVNTWVPISKSAKPQGDRGHTNSLTFFAEMASARFFTIEEGAVGAERSGSDANGTSQSGRGRITAPTAGPIMTIRGTASPTANPARPHTAVKPSESRPSTSETAPLSPIRVAVRIATASSITQHWRCGLSACPLSP